MPLTSITTLTVEEAANQTAKTQVDQLLSALKKITDARVNGVPAAPAFGPNAAKPALTAEQYEAGLVVNGSLNPQIIDLVAAAVAATDSDKLTAALSALA